MTRRIAVLGATGGVGRPLLPALLAAGVAVRALVGRGSLLRTTLPPYVEQVAGDVAEPALLDAALRGQEALCLLLPERRDAPALGRKVIAAARRAGIQRVVYHPSQLAALPGRVGISDQHAEIEEQMRRSAFDYAVLRPYAIGQAILSLAAAPGAGLFVTPVAKGRVALGCAQDIAAVAAGLLTDPAPLGGAVHTLSGAEAHGFYDITALLSRKTGREIGHRAVSATSFAALLQLDGGPRWLAHDITCMMQALEAGAQAVSTGTLAALLGRKPRSLVEAIEGGELDTLLMGAA